MAALRRRKLGLYSRIQQRGQPGTDGFFLRNRWRREIHIDAACFFQGRCALHADVCEFRSGYLLRSILWLLYRESIPIPASREFPGGPGVSILVKASSTSGLAGKIIGKVAPS